MADGILELLGRIAHPARNGRRVVDHRVPLPTFQGLEITVPVTPEFLDFRKQVGIRLAAIEQRDMVAALERVTDLMRPDEAGTSQDQDTQGISPRDRPPAIVLDSTHPAERERPRYGSGYLQECPNIGKLLNNLEFSLAMENEVMHMILEDGMEPEKAARQWLQKNPTVLEKWLQDVTTRDGQNGLEQVQNYLK